MQNHKEEGSALIERISKGSKEFYSAGSTFSTFACAAVVLIVWSTASRRMANHAFQVQFLRNEMAGLILSFVIVLAYAWVIPEPRDYPNADRS